MIGLLLCRLGWHALMEPGNCSRCGYRYHGRHAEPYATWRRRRHPDLTGYKGINVVCDEPPADPPEPGGLP